MGTALAGRLGLLLAMVLLLAPPSGGASADDVPEAAKKKFEEARVLYGKGDAKSLQAAFSALSEAKAKAPDSADFWELFVRVWRASKKSEADLWEKIIAPREQAVPKSPTFDIVRARVETDPAKKGEHLQKAIDKDPASVTTRLMLVAHYRALGEEGKAEELLDKILVDKPDDEQALIAKTEMMVESGLSRSAVTFAKDALAKKECPALRYALALALRKLSQEDAAVKPQALEEAKKAVDGKADPAYVATLADLLDENDRTAEAVTLLKTHYEKTGDLRLGKRLGVFAFRSGDYDAAVKTLAIAAVGDAKAAKALAWAHARRGRSKEAKAALDQLLAHDKEAALFAAEVEQFLGDAAGMRKRLTGATGDEAALTRTTADAMEGKAAEVTTALSKTAASGTVEGENALLTIVNARFFARLGTPRVAAYHKQDLANYAQVTATAVPEAKAGPLWLHTSVRCGGYMPRLVNYLLSACGTAFVTKGGQLLPHVEAGVARIGWTVLGEAECARDPQRLVMFNGKELKQGEQNVQIDIPQNKEDWDVAEKAFTDGCAALAAEDPVKAAEQFGIAGEKEPAWHRAKLFRAFARAFVAGADLKAISKEAFDALADQPGDWYGRYVAISLALWAGADVAEPMKSLAKHMEERSKRRQDDL